MTVVGPFQQVTWPLAPVGSFVDLENGYPFDSETFASESGVPLVRIRDLSASDFSTFVPEPVSSRVMLQDGDVVIGMDGDFNVIRWCRGPAALNQRLCRLRAKPGNDLRYVEYALPSVLVDINATQFATTVKHLSSGEILGSRIPCPPLEEQRRIADFLDDQVTRIDQAIHLRTRQVELVQSDCAARLDEILTVAGPTVRLSQVSDPMRPIQYGIVLPGPDFAGGVPIVKGGDVSTNRLHPDLLNRTDPDIESRYPRSRLVAGDLLIAIRGSVGEVAEVPASLEGANITQDAARIAPKFCDAKWLRWTLQTPTVQNRIKRQITGATVTGINIGSLRRVKLPDVPYDLQVRLGQEAESLSSRTSRLSTLITQSVTLLHERKRSLITAAVTGEFDVSSASSRAADDVTEVVGV